MVCMPICSSHGGAATSGRRRADGASEMLDMSEINVTALARVYDPAALHGRMHAQVPPPAKVRRRVLCVRHWCTSACVRAAVPACSRAHWLRARSVIGAYGAVQDGLAIEQRSAGPPKRRSAPRTTRIDGVIDPRQTFVTCCRTAVPHRPEQDAQANTPPRGANE